MKLCIPNSPTLARKRRSHIPLTVRIYVLGGLETLILRAVGLYGHLKIRRAARTGTHGRLGCGHFA